MVDVLPPAADGTVSGWTVQLADGSDYEWSGFYTGPLELSAGEVADAAWALLGLSPDDVAAASEALIRPAVSDDGQGPAIILHSATPVLMTLAGDLDSVRYGRVPEDVATFVETRAVALARPGDVVVGRSRPWKVAAASAGVEMVEVPGIEFYYLSHAIIRLLLGSGPGCPPIQRLAAVLRARPDTVVRVYCLDFETQIVLLCLQRVAGIEGIYTDANSPQVGGRWNAKAPLHPVVREAADVDAEGTVGELLERETRLAAWSRELAVDYERVPGYAIDAAGADPGQVAQDLVLAARLLRSRYGLETAYLKPSAGAGGNRILAGLSLSDEDLLRQLAHQMARSAEWYVLEAHVHYLPVRIGSTQLRVNPSAHVRFGKMAAGLTFQLSSDTAWQGNLYCDRRGWTDLGLAGRHYDRVRETVEGLRSALARYGQTLVTGGVDFAVGRVAGRFADHVFVAPQDPNLSSHGAEYLRRYRDQVKDAFDYTVTKVVCPTTTGDLPALGKVAARAGVHLAVMCSVPGHWGMIAAAAESPQRALDTVAAFETDLIRAGLAVRHNH